MMISFLDNMHTSSIMSVIYRFVMNIETDDNRDAHIIEHTHIQENVKQIQICTFTLVASSLGKLNSIIYDLSSFI